MVGFQLKSNHDGEGSWPPASTWSWVLIVAIVAGCTFMVMVYPFDFRTVDGSEWLVLRHSGWLAVLANLVLFLPIGLVEGCLADHVFGRRAWAMWVVTVDVAAISLIGETAQFWLPTRCSSMVDLVANTLGGVLGGWVSPVVWQRAGQ